MVECLTITYYGHAAVGLELGGKRIIIDPHDGYSLGLNPIPDKADVVLVTHEHFDHNAKESVAKPDTLVVSSFVGEKKISHNGLDFKLVGFRLPHDRAGGRRRGMVSAYLLELSGYRILHMGDVGVMPEEAFYNGLGASRIDLLFIPVGGVFTIEPYEAWEVAEKINPIYTVPIHYWRKGLNLPVAPLSDFLKFARTGKVEVENSFRYCGGEKEAKTRILVFKGMY